MSEPDVPPPYTAVAQHGMFPAVTHDEAARYIFLANLNRYLCGQQARLRTACTARIPGRTRPRAGGSP